MAVLDSFVRLWSKPTGYKPSPAPKTIGDWAERVAAAFLQRNGLELVMSNYRCSLGEIDLIMQHGPCMIFVEVRYRTCSRYGNAVETIDARKRQRLTKTAQRYIQTNALNTPCRFDVVAIQGDKDNHNIEWIKGAFDA